MSSDLIYRVACFLEEIAKYKAAEDILHSALRNYQNESQTLEVAKCHYTIGRVCYYLARYVDSETRLQQSKELYVPLPFSSLLPGKPRVPPSRDQPPFLFVFVPCFTLPSPLFL
jgi:hypothetical protein